MSDFWNYFWVLIILFSVLPLLQQKVWRLAVMKRLETSRKSRSPPLIPPTGGDEAPGFPLMRFIDIKRFRAESCV